MTGLALVPAWPTEACLRGPGVSLSFSVSLLVLLTFLFCHSGPLFHPSRGAFSAHSLRMSEPFDHVDGSQVSDDESHHSAVQGVVGGTTYYHHHSPAQQIQDLARMSLSTLSDSDSQCA